MAKNYVYTTLKKKQPVHKLSDVYNKQ